jgi:hypothetical protein
MISYIADTTLKALYNRISINALTEGTKQAIDFNGKTVIGYVVNKAYATTFGFTNDYIADLKMRNIVGLPIPVSRKALDECIVNIKNNVVDTFIVLLAATLHDEFGFGEKRVHRAIDVFNFKAECLADDYCTWNDYIEVIKDELNIELSIRTNNKDVKC